MIVEEYRKSCNEFVGKVKPLFKEFENYTKTIQPEINKLKQLSDSFKEKYDQYLENKTQTIIFLYL